MPIYKSNGGSFKKVTSLSVVQAGIFKPVVSAWTVSGGVFKKVFSTGPVYEDPSAYYDISGATIPSIGPGIEARTWAITPCGIPLTAGGTLTDVSWSTIECVTMDTLEVLSLDTYSTGTDQPSAKLIEYKSTPTRVVILGSYRSTNLNFAVADRGNRIGAVVDYNYLKPLLHAAEFADKYGRQLGIRWRWKSESLGMYFEHIFTGPGMIMNPV